MKDLLVNIKDIIISLSAVTTACIAFNGLHKWKKELKGKVYFDIAREHIRSTYKLRDEIEFARSAATFSHEYPDYYDSFEKDPLKRAEAYRYIYTNKIEPVRLAVQNFDLTTLESEALWGKVIKQKSRKLRSMYFRLSSAIHSYIDDIESGGDNFRHDPKFRKEVRADLWIQPTENDSFSVEMINIIDEIESEIRPYLDKNK